jgi:hypothetical protein
VRHIDWSLTSACVQHVSDRYYPPRKFFSFLQHFLPTMRIRFQTTFAPSSHGPYFLSTFHPTVVLNRSTILFRTLQNSDWNMWFQQCTTWEETNLHGIKYIYAFVRLVFTSSFHNMLEFSFLSFQKFVRLSKLTAWKFH